MFGLGLICKRVLIYEITSNNINTDTSKQLSFIFSLLPPDYNVIVVVEANGYGHGDV